MPKGFRSDTDANADAPSRLRDPTQRLNDHGINEILRLVTAYKTQAVSCHILNSNQNPKIHSEVIFIPLNALVDAAAINSSRNGIGGALILWFTSLSSAVNSRRIFRYRLRPLTSCSRLNE